MYTKVELLHAVANQIIIYNFHRDCVIMYSTYNCKIWRRNTILCRRSGSGSTTTYYLLNVESFYKLNSCYLQRALALDYQILRILIFCTLLCQEKLTLITQFKGSSINHVDMEGGRKVNTLTHKPDLVKLSAKWSGGQNAQNTVNMVYGSPNKV